MDSSNLANLAKIGKLKAEPGHQKEFDGLVRSGRVRLEDARKESLSIESRFDLAYNASNALALAALRWHGYRSDNRYIVLAERSAGRKSSYECLLLLRIVRRLPTGFAESSQACA